MIYIKKVGSFMNSYSAAKLRELHRKEKDYKAKMRLLCGIHRKEGKTIIEISEIMNLPKSTVDDCLRRLKCSNLSKLYDKKNKGAIPKLRKMQEKELKRVLSKEPSKVGLPFVFWTTKLVYFYVKKEYKKEFTFHGIRKMLYRYGFTRQKPRQMHYKGNSDEQERFKKNLDERLRNILKEDLRSSSWMKVPLS